MEICLFRTKFFIISPKSSITISNCMCVHVCMYVCVCVCILLTVFSLSQDKVKLQNVSVKYLFCKCFVKKYFVKNIYYVNKVIMIPKSWMTQLIKEFSQNYSLLKMLIDLVKSSLLYNHSHLRVISRGKLV